MTAKYKFTYQDKIYYVTEETESHVVTQCSDGRVTFTKDHLQDLFEKDKIDFTCKTETKPKFVEE